MCIAPVGLSILGAYMVFWPAESVLRNRDNAEETSPPSAGEIRSMRAFGVIAFVGGIYLLYRMLGGTLGAGPPDPDFDSLVKRIHALGVGLCRTTISLTRPGLCLRS